MRSPVDVRDVADEDELAAAFALRVRVFCDEQGVPEDEEVDEHDATARHLVAVAPGGDVVATCRIRDVEARALVGRMVVDAAWRGHGIAARLLALCREHAEARGAAQLALSAQTHAVGMYERSGYRVVSGEYDDAGIPHVSMRLDLA